MTVVAAGSFPARPQSIRTMNQQLLLDHIRCGGKVSRAELARESSLSKPTVSVALADLQRKGLVRRSGVRTGVPGPAAILYELDPEAGYALALDVGRQFLRGAIVDFSGALRARASVRAKASSGRGRVAELIRLGSSLVAQAGVNKRAITQTVVGSPGVYDRARDALSLAGALTGWDRPLVLTELRAAFGASLVIENDVDAAALAERELGHGRDADSFAFVSVGTGIGMGLVLGGRLHRGAHGVAGEIGYLPLESAESSDAEDARKRGGFEAAASAAGIVRAAHRAGMRGPISARQVFAAAERGDPRAVKVVDHEALLVAKAICAVVTVADPQLVVLGGGVGQADGFIDAVRRELRQLAPVVPDLRVSTLGTDAVVDGCLAAGTERAWELVLAALPAGATADGSSSKD